MKKAIFYTAIVALCVLFGTASCKQDAPLSGNESTQNERPSGTKRIDVLGDISQVLNDNDLKINIDDNYGAVDFTVGDKVYAYAEVSENQYVFLESSISEIVTAGYSKKGRFSLDVPNGTTYVCCSLIPLQYKDGGLYVPSSPAFSNRSLFQDIPAYLEIDLSENGNADTSVSGSFSKFGCLVSAEIMNSTASPITGTLTWSAEYKDEPGVAYQELGGKMFEGITLQNPSDIPAFDGNKKITIGAGETAKVFTYLMPQRIKIPAMMRLHFTPDGKAALTTKAKNKKDNTKPWQSGRWIKFPKVEYKGEGQFGWWKAPVLPKTPAYRFKSSKTGYSSVSFYFYLYAEEEDKPLVWLDYNGDGKYNTGESPTSFGGMLSARYTPADQYAFYGPLTKLDVSGGELTEFYLEGENPKLSEIIVCGNSITIEKMQLLINSLPNRSSLGEDNYGRLIAVNPTGTYPVDNNHISKDQVNEALAKGWVVYDKNKYGPLKPYPGE